MAHLPATRDRAGGHPLDKIQHIVIVVQENRSLNNLFYGFPGAKTQSYGLNPKNHKNQKIALQPVDLSSTWDLEHNAAGFEAACNGTGKTPGAECRMNGFTNETWTCGGANPPCPIKYPPYSYVPHDESAPYLSMGKQYVLADQMYASNFDTSSFVSHQYIIGAQANSTINYPLTNWACPGGKTDTIWKTDAQRGFVKEVPVCFDNTTLADELDAEKISWAFYASPVGGEGQKACGDGSAPETCKETNGIWSAPSFRPPRSF